MKNLTVLLFFVAGSIFTTKAQKKYCVQDTNKIEDLNSISKCAIKRTNSSNKKISSTKNLHYLKRRNKLKKRKIVSSRIHIYTNTLKTTSVGIDDLKKEIVSVTNFLKARKIKKYSVIDFNEVQNIPQFRSCDNSKTPNECFNIEMSKHIKKHFTYPKVAINKNLQGNILVTLTIDNEGLVKIIQISGHESSELLKKEAKRVVKKLPQFIPATHNGEKVFVKYTLPINFSL